MNIGVLCPSEIAYRRFMPALLKTNIHFEGIGINSPEERYGCNIPERNVVEKMLQDETGKAKMFIDSYGGRLFSSYEEIINNSEIEAIYIPLPPGLHYQWAKKALEAGKHVLVEKPATISLNDTLSLVHFAEKKRLALHENYMFAFHAQLDAIEQTIKDGEIGDIRLYSIRFGFPMRAVNDFRYVKALGGGALIDAGGYCIKYAKRLLGDDTKIVCANLGTKPGFEVDIYGSGTLANDQGSIVQIAFGMDNDYKCELEVWGSKGTLKTGRVLTAPAGFVPNMTISKNGEVTTVDLPADDTFQKSILHFAKCIDDSYYRNKNYVELIKQAELVENFSQMALRRGVDYE